VTENFEILLRCTGFEWDDHNSEKNWIKHGVTPSECEEMFFNRPLIVQDDTKHSKNERRFYSLGRTEFGRLLFVVFAIRKDKIRVISARDMSRKEKKESQSHEEKSS
jgi:uncharacterized protein